LKGIEAVEADADEIVEQFVDISTRVDEHVLAPRMDGAVHLLEHGIDELPP